MKFHAQIPSNETTREKILRIAEEEIYLYGYQGFRIDALLKRAEIAKGALYHYFPTKLDLGYAVVDEALTGYFMVLWHESSEASNGDILLGLQNFLRERHTEISSGECVNGCGLSNLIQEMSILDEGFNSRLRKLIELIIGTVSQSLAEGQATGVIKSNIDPVATSHFIMASYQGIMGMAKCMQDKDLVANLFESLCEYVGSLRA